MGSEAPLLRVGEVRLGDLRAIFGASLASMGTVDVLTLDMEDATPVASRIELIDIRAGRGNHRALRCPSCGAARSVLLARRGSLACRSCRRHRTRQQLEHRRADWSRGGGREEDELFRVFRPARRLTPARVERARELALALLAADEVRVRDLRTRLDSFTASLESPR